MEVQFFVFLAAISVASGLNFNITNLDNCRDVALNYQKDAEIEVTNVSYERNANGFYDVLHGKYLVHVYSPHIGMELLLYFYKCALDSVGMCKENLKEYAINDMTCMQFLNDPTGPWYIFSPAMDPANVCAELQGTYDFTGAHLNATFVEKYMKVEEGRHRMRAIVHLPGENMDLKNLRGCVDLEFNILP